MPETLDPARHVKPFVYESLTTKALHFSISEIQSRMDLRDPYALDLEYTRLMMAFLMLRPDPRDILMLGLGGGSLAKYCYRFLPSARIQVVEINPHVIDLRDVFQVPRDDARFHVVHGDGGRHVRLRHELTDVLLVDAYDHEGLPPRLCSQRFYRDCHRLLHPGGVMVVNLYQGNADHQAYVDRIKASFGDAVLAVTDSDESNCVVFACKGHNLDAAALGVVRRPPGLSRGAMEPLLGEFSRFLQALRNRVDG